MRHFTEPSFSLGYNMKVKIHSILPLNHNVRCFRTEKPDDYHFQPGQATLVAIDKDGLREEKRPFTFSSLPQEDTLEFTIKIYPTHEGVTDSMDDLQPGDSLILDDAWGAITYQGTGTFIAGGAGVTPFLSILRDQAQKNGHTENQLLFSNRTLNDLFLVRELDHLTHGNMDLIFTQEDSSRYPKQRVDKAYLQKWVNDYDRMFYVCGPPSMVEEVQENLRELGASSDKIVTEEA